MKNIHVLPTEKPSRLFEVNGELSFTKEYSFYNGIEYKNIYITSDEEIKEGDWFYLDDAEIIAKYINLKPVEEAKKIILTTDQELIKDGVQSIDDEFLEWFVKNPSCESVEVDRGYLGIAGFCKSNEIISEDKVYYKIIIPKEEPKHIGKALSTEEVMNNRSSAYEFIDFDKQETLEEVAKNESEYLADYDDKEMYQRGFIDGAKWQQEQNSDKKWSEDDLKEAFDSAREFNSLDGIVDIHIVLPMGGGTNDLQPLYLTFNEWFEQFKNK